MAPPPTQPAAKIRRRVLVVDDQMAMAEMVADGLTEKGFEAQPVASSQDAVRWLEQERVDALVTDLRMPSLDGLALLAISKRTAPLRPVILMTAFSAVDTAIEAIRQGAYHYLTKPFKVEELALFLDRAFDEASVRHEAAALRRVLQDRFSLENLLGGSAAMREVRDLIERVADSAAPVLICGETGTGKGVVARAIHARSPRAAAPFVSLNCAALPEALLESELFGHVKGAFTNATATRIGLLEGADGGTLFLDEIAEMALSLQAKLLHVLENGAVRAVGSNKERNVDVRIIAATHRNLRQRAKTGAFREDLIYRLDVVNLEMPPLRDRIEDLPELVEHFLALSKRRYPRSTVERFSAEALARMSNYQWPGNVRELEHCIERLVLLGREPEVPVERLPQTVISTPTTPAAFQGEILPLREIGRRYARWAYEQVGGKKTVAAERLQIDFKTLSKMLLAESEDPA